MFLSLQEDEFKNQEFDLNKSWISNDENLEKSLSV